MKPLTDLIEFLQQIPATFWGVVFGSFFSIVGVWLTNRASTARLQVQFQHERGLKTKERELALKKDIYLDAAEAVSIALASIAKFGNLDLPNDKVMEEYLKKSPAFAKVQVVGEMETVDALLDFTGELGAVLLKLWVRRHQLIADKNQISILDGQVTVYQKESDRFLEMMKQYNLNNSVDASRWSVLQKNFDFEHKRTTEGIRDRQTSANQLAARHLEFIGECSMATISVSTLILPLLLAVRKELEMPLELEKLQASMEKSLEKQQKSIEEYLSNISTSIHPKPSVVELTA